MRLRGYRHSNYQFRMSGGYGGTCLAQQWVDRPWGDGSSGASNSWGTRRTPQCYSTWGARYDNRISYVNPTYPWIHSLHAFRNGVHRPQGADVARFRFPPGTTPGRYVIHYYWGGYRDCMDVDVLP